MFEKDKSDTKTSTSFCSMLFFLFVSFISLLLSFLYFSAKFHLLYLYWWMFEPRTVEAGGRRGENKRSIEFIFIFFCVDYELQFFFSFFSFVHFLAWCWCVGVGVRGCPFLFSIFFLFVCVLNPGRTKNYGRDSEE